MILIAFIAIIAAVAIPSLLNAGSRATKFPRSGSLRTISSVNQQYRTRFQSYAGNLADLSAANYVR